MTDTIALHDQALTAIRSESRVGPHFKPTRLEIAEDGTATIEAEVENVALKRLALERLASMPGITAVVDRVHVTPAVPKSDDGILDDLRKAFYDEPAFRTLAINEAENNHLKPVRDAFEDHSGEIVLEVHDGVVILNGRVPGLTTKRLAGVLAWWVPGSRDVLNGISVDPPEEDSPDLIEEAVRVALDKDPFVDAEQVRVGVRNRTVRLTGLLPRDARDAAEWDAWYVFGVDDVINEIETSP